MLFRRYKIEYILILVVVFFSQFAFAAVTEYNSMNTNITTCGEITESGSYTLFSDLDGSDPLIDNPTGNGDSRFANNYGCLLITVSNVDLDCQGYRISNVNQSYWNEYYANDPTGGTFGILYQDDANGVLDTGHINNCIVSNFTNGIVVYSTQNVLVENSKATNNLENGFWFMRVDGAAEGDIVSNISGRNLSSHQNQHGLSISYVQNSDPLLDLNLSENLVGLNVRGTGELDASNLDLSDNVHGALQLFEDSYLDFTNVDLGATTLDLSDIGDIRIIDEPAPQTPGNPSVEIAVSSTNTMGNGGATTSIGISDGDIGSQDFTLFGPTSMSEYTGAVAFSFGRGGVPFRQDLNSVDILDITGSGDYSGDLGLDDDDNSSEIMLPFNVSMFGRLNDRIKINNNGFIYISNNKIDAGAGCCNGPFLNRMEDDLDPDATNISNINGSFIIAGSWADLVPNTGSPSSISYGTLGTTPDRVFVIEYLDLSPIANDGDGGFTFQIKLYENATEDNGTLELPMGYFDIGHFIRLIPTDQNTGYPVSGPFIEVSSFGDIKYYYSDTEVTSVNEDTLTLAKYQYQTWDTNAFNFSELSYNPDPISNSIFSSTDDFGFGGIYGIIYDNVSKSSQTSNLSEWRMFGRFLDHRSYDGNDFPIISGLNRRAYNTEAAIESSPSVANGFVYIGNRAGVIYQFNATDITDLIATKDIGSTVYSTPVTAGDYVYIGSQDHIAYQLNASNVSQLIATYTLFNPIPYPPVVANGYAYFVDDGGNVIQLNANNISEEVASFNASSTIGGALAISGNSLYIVTEGGQIYQLNASNISQQLSSASGVGVFTSTPLVYDNRLYVGNLDQNIYIFNAQDVSVQLNNYDTGSAIFSAPAISNGYVYVTSGNTLNQLSTVDLSSVSSYTFPDSLSSSPTIVNGYVYVGCDDGKLYQLDASDVSVLIKTFATGNVISGSAAVANGYVYFGNEDGFFFQLNSTNITRINYLPASIVLTSSNGTNTTTENLTVSYSSSLLDGNTYNITNWFVNGKSIEIVNFPFEGGADPSAITRNYASIISGSISGSGVNWDSSAGFDGYGAYLFDGSGGYIEVLGYPSTEYTISAWVRPATVFENQSIVVGTTAAGAFTAYSNEIFIQNGKIAQYLFDGGGEFALGSTDLASNTWYFVTVTAKSNDYMRVYVNGVEDGAPVAIGTIWDGGDRFQIGAETPLGLAFNGTVDDLHIYNRSLSTEQVYDLYNVGRYQINSHELNDSDVWQACLTQTNQTIDTENFCSNSLTVYNSIIRFEPPTLTDGTEISGVSTRLNLSVNPQRGNLQELRLNWSDTIYSLYNDNLVLMLNLNNRSSIGEDDTTLVDTSLYANGANQNGLTWDSNGKYGGAFFFNGDGGYIEIPHTSALEFTNDSDFTISEWVYPTAKAEMDVFDKSVDDFGSGQFQIWHSFNEDGHITCRVGKEGEVWDAVQSTSYYQLNRWISFTCVKSGSELSIYVNGKLENTITIDFTDAATNTVPINIGRFRRDGDSFFHGRVDEVRVWKVALNADEIDIEYRSNLDEYAIGHWNFFADMVNLNGTYSFSACENDTMGGSECTNTRTIEVTPNPIFSESEASDEWRMFGRYMNHTAYDGNEYPVIDGLNLARFRTTGTMSGTSPAIANGFVYTGDQSGYLYQLNATNASQMVATFQTHENFPLRGMPIIINGSVYASSDQYFYQLNATNVSQTINEFQPDEFVTFRGASSANGYVYVASWRGSGNNTLFQLDAGNITNIIGNFTEPTGSSLNDVAAIAGDYIYIGINGNANGIYQINASNISQEISFYPTASQIYSAVAVSNGFVYTVDERGTVYQLDANDVSIEISHLDTGFSPGSDTASILATNGFVYVGNANGSFYQLDGNDVSNVVNVYQGTGLINYATSAYGYIYIVDNSKKIHILDVNNVSNEIDTLYLNAFPDTSIAVGENYLYFGVFENYLYQVNATNFTDAHIDINSESSNINEWRTFGRYLNHTTYDGIFYPTIPGLNLSSYQTHDGIYSQPAVANGFVYVSSEDNFIYQLNASNIRQRIAKFDTGSWTDASPTVANGYVYIGGDNALYQLDVDNISNVINIFELEDDRFDASAIIADGFVFIGSDEGNFYKLNASNISQQLDKIETGNSIYGSAAVANGYVYFAGSDSRLYRLNESNFNDSASDLKDDFVPNSPVVYRGWVYYGGDDGVLYQYGEGSLTSLSSFEAEGSLYVNPAAANGYIYLGDDDGTFYQLDARNLNLVNTVYLGDWTSSDATIANGYVYVGGDDSIYQLDENNVSQIINIFELVKGGDAREGISIANGYLYFADDEGYVYQLNSTNISQGIVSESSESSQTEEIDWRMFGRDLNHDSFDGQYTTPFDGLNRATFATLNDVKAPPSVANEKVYVGSTDGMFYQLYINNISIEQNRFDAGSPIYAGASVTPEYIYLSTEEGTLYQLNTSNISQSLSTFSASDVINGTAIIANGFVYVGDVGGNLYQLDANDVSTEVSSLTTGGSIVGTPAATNQFVYVPSGSALYQVDATDVSTIVSTFTAGGTIESSPAVTPFYVLVASRDGFLHQLDVNDISNEIAIFHMGLSGTIGPMVSEGYVYVGNTSGTLFKLDINNISEIVDQVDLGSPISNSPSTYYGDIFVGTEDGKMHQLSLDNLSDEITYQTNGTIVSTAAVTGSYIYFGSDDGTVYQLSRSNISTDNVPFRVSFIDPTPADGAVLNENSMNLALSSTSISDHYTFVDLDRSLVMWMRMDDIDDDGNPLDISGYGNDGFAENGAFRFFDWEPHYGRTFELDGVNDYINVSNSDSLNVGPDMTISIWVKPETIDGSYRTIVGKWQVGVKQQYLIQIDSDNHFTFSTGNGAEVGNQIESATVPTIYQWYNIVGTVSGTHKKLYVNGVLEAETDEGIPLGSSDVELTLGQKKNEVGGLFEIFDGKVDNLLIFDRSLSDNEVASLHSSQTTQYENTFTNLAFSEHTIIGYIENMQAEKISTENRTISIKSRVENSGDGGSGSKPILYISQPIFDCSLRTFKFSVTNIRGELINAVTDPGTGANGVYRLESSFCKKPLAIEASAGGYRLTTKEFGGLDCSCSESLPIPPKSEGTGGTSGSEIGNPNNGSPQNQTPIVEVPRIIISESGQVGFEIIIPVENCPACELQVTDPSGKVTNLKQEGGNFKLKLDVEGQYKIELIKDGKVVDSRFLMSKGAPKSENSSLPPSAGSSNNLIPIIIGGVLIIGLGIIGVATYIWKMRKK